MFLDSHRFSAPLRASALLSPLGANYIIQLTGMGGLVPNTVLLDWPEDTLEETAQDFVRILSFAENADKAVLAVKGLKDFQEAEGGSIDVWWMTLGP